VCAISSFREALALAGFIFRVVGYDYIYRKYKFREYNNILSVAHKTVDIIIKIFFVALPPNQLVLSQKIVKNIIWL